MAEEEVEMPQVMDEPNPQPLPPFEPGKYYGGQMDNMPVEQERPTLPFTPGQYQGLDRPLMPIPGEKQIMEGMPPFNGRGEPPAPIMPEADFGERFKGDEELGGRPGISEQDFNSFVEELMRKSRPEPIYDDQPIDKGDPIPPVGEIDPRMIERKPTGPSSGPVVDPWKLLEQYFQQREQPDAAQAMINDVLNRRV